MDLTIRDWMVIIGVLLILAVLLDAYRRVRKDRRSGVKMKLVDVEGDEPEPEQEPNVDLSRYRELPNGGARTIRRDDLLKASAKLERQRAQEKRPQAEPVPERAAVEPASQQADPQVEEEVELLAGMSSAEPENMDWLDELSAPSRADTAQPPASRYSADMEPEVFMLHVVSRKPEGFRGDDVLHILLACDLRFGEMNFFHRHEMEAGRGAIQFSVANMMQPGVFDLDNMADFNTPGLIFFLNLPGPEDMHQAFDYMLETAQAVARNLEGDVLDETRSVITKQALEHSRQKIHDLERRMLAQAGG